MKTDINKRRPNKKRNSGAKVVLAAALVLIALIVLIIGGLWAYINLYKPNLDDDTPPFNVDTVEYNGGGEDTAEADPDVWKRDKQVVNFLLMGRDKDAWNTDVMMLINFDIRDYKISVMQIPRDTYVEIGDVRGRVNTLMKKMRLNAYAEDSTLTASELTKAGMEGTIALLEESMCIKIDGYAIANLAGFRNVVDILGGVYIDVPYRMFYDDPDQELYIDLYPGPQTLNGKQAEMFVRYRSGYVQGDLGRVNAQKIFLTAFFKQLKSSITLGNLAELAGEAIEHVTTDLSLSDIIYYAKEALKVDMENISLMTLPGKDIRASSGAWYYVMHRADSLTLVNEYFNVYNKDIADDMFDSTHAFTDEDASAFAEIYFADPTDAVVENAEDIDNSGLYIPLT